MIMNMSRKRSPRKKRFEFCHHPTFEWWSIASVIISIIILTESNAAATAFQNNTENRENSLRDITKLQPSFSHEHKKETPTINLFNHTANNYTAFPEHITQDNHNVLSENNKLVSGEPNLVRFPAITMTMNVIGDKMAASERIIKDKNKHSTDNITTDSIVMLKGDISNAGYIQLNNNTQLNENSTNNAEKLQNTTRIVKTQPISNSSVPCPYEILGSNTQKCEIFNNVSNTSMINVKNASETANKHRKRLIDNLNSVENVVNDIHHMKNGVKVDNTYNKGGRINESIAQKNNSEKVVIIYNDVKTTRGQENIVNDIIKLSEGQDGNSVKSFVQNSVGQNYGESRNQDGENVNSSTQKSAGQNNSANIFFNNSIRKSNNGYFFGGQNNSVTNFAASSGGRNSSVYDFVASSGEHDSVQSFDTSSAGQISINNFVTSSPVQNSSVNNFVASSGGQNISIKNVVTSSGVHKNGVNNFVTSSVRQNNSIYNLVTSSGEQNNSIKHFVNSSVVQNNGIENFVASSGGQNNSVYNFANSSGSHNNSENSVQNSGAQNSNPNDFFNNSVRGNTNVYFFGDQNRSVNNFVVSSGGHNNSVNNILTSSVNLNNSVNNFVASSGGQNKVGVMKNIRVRPFKGNKNKTHVKAGEVYILLEDERDEYEASRDHGLDEYDRTTIRTKPPEPESNPGFFGSIQKLTEGVLESLAERIIPKSLRDILKRMQDQSTALETIRLRSKEENGGLGAFGRSLLKGLTDPLSQWAEGTGDRGSLDSDRGFLAGLFSGVADSMGDAFKIKVTAIYPGTLWCGDGHVGETQSAEVGLFFMTDNCCRRHDSCRLYILAGESTYGLTNTGLFTRSHCSCDSAFYRCLKRTNTLVSSQIGATFFSILGPQCFKREHPIVKCARRTRITGQKCEEYEVDKTQPKIWQWFDSPTF